LGLGVGGGWKDGLGFVDGWAGVVVSVGFVAGAAGSRWLSDMGVLVEGSLNREVGLLVFVLGGGGGLGSGEEVIS
jgi:hypothetical protein